MIFLEREQLELPIPPSATTPEALAALADFQAANGAHPRRRRRYRRRVPTMGQLALAIPIEANVRCVVLGLPLALYRYRLAWRAEHRELLGTGAATSPLQRLPKVSAPEALPPTLRPPVLRRRGRRVDVAHVELHQEPQEEAKKASAGPVVVPAEWRVGEWNFEDTGRLVGANADGGFETWRAALVDGFMTERAETAAREQAAAGIVKRQRTKLEAEFAARAAMSLGQAGKRPKAKAPATVAEPARAGMESPC